jgi:hypothetical protein
MTNRADVNNNPGNLRPPGGKEDYYQGQIGIDDRGFAIFRSKEFGQRALLGDINAKISQGLNTPEKFIDKYAPAGKDNEENSEDSRINYKLKLASELGLKSTAEPFPKDSANRIAGIIYDFESGNRPPAQKSEMPPNRHFELDTSGLGKVSFDDQMAEMLRMTMESAQGADPGRVLGDAAAAAIGSKVPARLESFMEGYRNPPSKPPGVMGGALPTATPPAPIPTDPMHTRQMQGTTDAGATGRARQNTYQAGTSQQAAAASQQADVIEQLKRQGVVSGDARSVMAKAPGLTATPSGVLLPSSQVYADIPPTQGTKPPPPPPPQAPQPKGPGVLSRLQSGYRQAFPVGKTSLLGALGGLGMAEGARETSRRFEEDDMLGALLAGLGTVGSAGAMTPFPPARIAGTVAATASPLALYLYDKMRSRQTGSLPLPSVYARYQR